MVAHTVMLLSVFVSAFTSSITCHESETLQNCTIISLCFPLHD